MIHHDYQRKESPKPIRNGALNLLSGPRRKKA